MTPSKIKIALTLLAGALGGMQATGELAQLPSWVTQLVGGAMAVLAYAGYVAHAKALKQASAATEPAA